MRHKAFTVFLLTFFVFTASFTTYCYAEKLRIVEGLIENVTDDSVRVRGRDYSISGVPVRNASNEDLSKSSLRSGKRVELFFKNDKLTTILVHAEGVQ